MRLLMYAAPLPRMNSKEMEKVCDAMMARLWDNKAVDELLTKSVEVTEEIGEANKSEKEGGWTRDSIRTEPVTKGLFEKFGQRYHG